MKKEQRKKKTKVKLILLAILSFVLVVAICALLLVKVFVVKNVKVEGNALYEDELIKTTVLNDRYSWNSLYVWLKYSFMETDKVPFIDAMEIELINPQTINIKVYEKGMMGYLYIPAIGENAYFDKDGFVTETSTRIVDKVPKIEGLQCGEIVLYEKLQIEEKTLRQLLILTQALKREGLEPDAISYNEKNEPVLVYDKVRVQMGSGEYLTQKVERIKGILPKLSGMSGTLHLEKWTEESTNIVFEKQ